MSDPAYFSGAVGDVKRHGAGDGLGEVVGGAAALQHAA